MTEQMRRTLGALVIALVGVGAGLYIREAVAESLGGNIALIAGCAAVACLLVLAMELVKARD